MISLLVFGGISLESPSRGQFPQVQTGEILDGSARGRAVPKCRSQAKMQEDWDILQGHTCLSGRGHFLSYVFSALAKSTDFSLAFGSI